MSYTAPCWAESSAGPSLQPIDTLSASLAQNCSCMHRHAASATLACSSTNTHHPPACAVTMHASYYTTQPAALPRRATSRLPDELEPHNVRLGSAALPEGSRTERNRPTACMPAGSHADIHAPVMQALSKQHKLRGERCKQAPRPTCGGLARGAPARPPPSRGPSNAHPRVGMLRRGCSTSPPAARRVADARARLWGRPRGGEIEQAEARRHAWLPAAR